MIISIQIVIQNEINTSLKYLIFLFLFFLSVNTAYAQTTIEGRVLDSITKEPIPYVNIGIIELRMGTVSTPEGFFELAYKSKSDSVTFSSIGYKPNRVSINDLNVNSEVDLEPMIIMGDEIRVEAKSLGPLKVFGHKLDKKGRSIGYGSTKLGTEIGALIQFKNLTSIESAHFTVNFTGSDSMRYRLNIYEVENGIVGQNYLKENILIIGPQERGTFSIDLDDYDLVVEGDVMLSLEYIEAIKEVDENVMMFRAKQVLRKRKANLYMKYTSLSAYEKMDFINYQIGFYMKGRELGK